MTPENNLRNKGVLLKYTIKDSSSSYIAHVSLRIGIGSLGSLHHSDSLFPKNHFFLCLKHFKVTAH